jgi:hypothetical protein
VTASSWRRCRSLASLLLCLPLLGCLGETPDRAQLTQARVVRGAEGLEIEVTQNLKFSPTMLRALSRGIALRLVYAIDGCDGAGASNQIIQLRYFPLSREYELRLQGRAEGRRFARRSALLAALDRIHLPLGVLPEPCSGGVFMALDLTSLPTPLRFPALLRPAEWRMVSPRIEWHWSPRAGTST